MRKNIDGYRFVYCCECQIRGAVNVYYKVENNEHKFKTIPKIIDEMLYNHKIER